jgi:hypothetical protein
MAWGMNRAAFGEWVPAFVRASNRLAGINREPTAAEISAHRGLFAVESLRVENLELFIHHIAPGAKLRDNAECSPEMWNTDEAEVEAVRNDLATILAAARANSAAADRLHRIYRLLHPFTDANGRSARALWMWQQMRFGSEGMAEVTRHDPPPSLRHPRGNVPARSMMM